MFQTLIASAPPSHASFHRLVLAVWLHAVLVGGAVALTRQQSAGTISRESRMPVTLDPFPIRRVPSAPSGEARSDHGSIAPPPTETPIDPGPHVPDLRPDLPTIAGLLAGASRLADSSPRAGGSPGGAGGPDRTAPLAPTEVDQPVEVLERPSVRYPPRLAQAGIPGRVEVEFVVDTLGRVEAESVRALSSTRPEFELAARVAVLATRFRPARWRGRPVRQLVRQALTFRAEPRR